MALGRRGANTAAIAGGQSLLPMLNLRVALIDLLVDISRLDDLKTVTETPDSVWLGALTTHAAIEDGKTPDIFSGLMRRVAGQISYRAVRNHGTIGGSVALADPAADWPCCLIALDATLRIVGRNGVRVERVADFIHDSYATTLTTGDIIMGFDIPAPKAPLRWGFAKVARKSGAFAQSIAIAVTQGKDGPVSAALGAAGPRPLSADCDRASAYADRQHGRAGARCDRRRPRHPFCRARRLSKADAHGEHPARRAGHAGPMTAITVELNGVKINDDVEPRQTLADFLRDRCGLTATHLGCEHGACGACTVVVDGDCDALVPDACRHVRRPLGHDARRAAQRSGDGAAAPAFPREPRPAMRLLHAGHADHGARHPAAARAARMRRPSATN